jgi:hypothetical protein
MSAPDALPDDSFAAFATFLGMPLPDDPVAALRILRREAAKAVESLLAFLDLTDGDPDLEPSLGQTAYTNDPATVDVEGDDSDKEPSLGWTAAVKQAGQHWHGELQDSELDDCDKEDSGDTEPNGDERDHSGAEDDHFASGLFGQVMEGFGR